MEFLLFWIFIAAMLVPVAIYLDTKRNNKND
jgi:hypothetical protein